MSRLQKKMVASESYQSMLVSDFPLAAGCHAVIGSLVEDRMPNGTRPDKAVRCRTSSPRSENCPSRPHSNSEAHSNCYSPQTRAVQVSHLRIRPECHMTVRSDLQAKCVSCRLVALEIHRPNASAACLPHWRQPTPPTPAWEPATRGVLRGNVRVASAASPGSRFGIGWCGILILGVETDRHQCPFE